jgi:hypothetical protein
VFLGSYWPDNLPVSVSVNAGVRLDQSARSVEDVMQLSLADRMALGVSDSHALLLGVGAAYRHGPFEPLVEWSWDVLVGRNAPALRESPMRVSQLPGIDAGADRLDRRRGGRQE